MKMTKQDLVKAIAERSGKTQKDAREFIDVLKDVVFDALADGNEVSPIDGVKLSVKEVEARTCRNPRTGETLEVPAHKSVVLKRGAVLKTFFKD